MQAIPDKDFNQAFQQKFEMFEVEPSSKVWKGIVSELDGGKKKKSLTVIRIMAAASVLLILGSGLFLLAPKDRVRLQGKADEAVATQQEIQSDPTVIAALPKTVKSTKIHNVPVTINTLHIEAIPVLKSSPGVQTVAIVQEAPKNTEAKSVAKDMELTKQDNQFQKENKEVMPAVNRPPVLAFANDQISMPDTGRYLTSQKRSRSGAGLLGSVVNYVVGKVDPREDKLIKISDDEDGGTEISGINLGVLKLKKQNR